MQLRLPPPRYPGWEACLRGRNDERSGIIAKEFVGMCFCSSDVMIRKKQNSCGNKIWYGLLCLCRCRVLKYQHYFREVFSYTWVLEKFTSKSCNKRLETFMVFVCFYLWLFDTYVTDTFVCLQFFTGICPSCWLRFAPGPYVSQLYAHSLNATLTSYSKYHRGLGGLGSGMHVTVRNLKKKPPEQKRPQNEKCTIARMP